MTVEQLARQRAARTKRERTRAAIIGAATDLFERKGFLPTSVQEIAQQAGVGAATLYKHFPTKNVIAGHVFRPLIEDLLADERWTDPAIDPVTALQSLVVDVVSRAKANTALTVALLEAIQDSTARRGTQIDEGDPRFWVPLPPLFKDIISRGQAKGCFLDYPSAEEAGPMVNNWILLRILTRPNESKREALRFTLTTVSRLLGFENQPAAS